MKKLNFEDVYKTYCEYAEQLKPYVCDTVTYLHKALEEDKKVIVGVPRQPCWISTLVPIRM